MLFVSSDLHLYHKRVIEYSKRPFSSMEEMHKTIITNINKKVSETDELYLLGDTSFGTIAQIEAFFHALKCKNIHLILGNHDREIIEYRERLLKLVKSIENYKEVSVADPDANRGYQKLVLFHFPILEWNKGHHGSWMLHGHTHGNIKYPPSLTNKRILDVGVDCWNFEPLSYEDIKKKFKNCEDIIHHGD